MEDNSSSFAGNGTSEAVTELLNSAAGIEQVEQPLEAEKPTEEVKKVDDPLAGKFAALSRREKAISQREKRIAQLEAELEAKNAQQASTTPEEPEISLEEMLRKDPLSALQKKGYTLEQLAQIALNDGKLPLEAQMQLKMEELESKYARKLEEMQNSLLEKDKTQAEAQLAKEIEDFKYEIENTLAADPDKYELINHTGSMDEVYDLIVQHYNATIDPETNAGEILDINEAADMVEQYLLEEANKVLKAKKLQALIGQKEPVKQTKEPSQSSQTLTNSNSTALADTPGHSYVSDEESLREAAKLLVWDND